MVPGMSFALAGLAIAALVAGAALVVRQRRGRTMTLLVSAEPETALLSSAAALRRLGAHITRYDAEAGTLEARLSTTDRAVRLHATAHDDRTTRVRLEGDAPTLIRGFRTAIQS